MKRSGRCVVTTHGAEETRRLGELIASRLDAGVCVALVGPLGAGKTEWVRGACRGLGVDEHVLSPTFILYEEFEGRVAVVHVDLYRLEHEFEIEALGVFDRMGADCVLLVEWADRSDTLMEGADVVVTIGDAQDADADSRRVEISYAPRLAAVFEGMES